MSASYFILNVDLVEASNRGKPGVEFLTLGKQHYLVQTPTGWTEESPHHFQNVVPKTVRGLTPAKDSFYFVNSSHQGSGHICPLTRFPSICVKFPYG